MRFLSPLTIGSILRPSSSLVSTQLPRVAWASTSASLGSQSSAGALSAESTTIGSDDTEELRLKAIKLYKELHRLGRDYPDPNYEFNKRLRRAFEKKSKTKDPAALQKQLELGEHIKKEVLALISLKKFRHLRRTYHANEGPR